MNGFAITFISIFYLLFLFYLAFIAEKVKRKNKSLINNPIVYALSLAIYCTAWTFYGSVGRVKNTGLEFLSVYLGPTLFMILAWSVLRKIVRISHVHSLTSIADFISARYGKYRSLGVWVTLISFMAGVPYIGLQIKAIAISVEMLSGNQTNALLHQQPVVYIVLLITVFTLFFGTRKIQKNETHEGMVFAIAGESIVKLLAFLIVGIYITFFIGKGFSNIFQNHYHLKSIEKAFEFENNPGYGNWFIHIMLSGFAFMFLPRQFQIAVVENQNEKNIRQSIWMVPLYLFLINIFVVPIAILGSSILGHTSISADNYLIALPLLHNAKIIALVAYIGGFSAASGMIVVETIAISTMLTNSIILPFLLENRRFKEKFTFKILKVAIWLRRICIILTVLLGFSYYRIVSNLFSLVSIGLIAFVGVAQFAPSILGGIFWKGATKKGALMGLIAGFVIWLFALIINPLLISINFSPEILQGIKAFYHFFEIFKISYFDDISNTTFWSLLANTTLFVIYSNNSSQSALEAQQALLFVDVFIYSNSDNQSGVWKGIAKNEQFFSLLASFIGSAKAKKTLEVFAKKNKIDLNLMVADPKIVNYIENILGGIIGTSSARILVSSISKEEIIPLDEMVEILRRSQKIIEDNEELKSKSRQLKIISDELKIANEELLKTDNLKNDFLTTVTHEIRTPLTSIKALSEIIIDNDDLDENQKKLFLETIINETERLSRLVNQVLDLERYESGKNTLNTDRIIINEFAVKIKKSFENIAREKNIELLIEDHSKLEYILGDQDKFLQMLINLVSNAIKFCPIKNGKVKLKFDNVPNFLLISVKDNGIGIPKEAGERIFEKFFQAENHSENQHQGSGLGLSITKKIVELHHGKMEFESEENKGTTFRIYLPIKN